ncbi:hypothetical protein TrVE_jg11521 [Triparma verrucosa]|uniref:5-hmdU DNA kinase helical domain-containing protein n=1 Tax=Triparma verrucosa TaxID=1606542 RepID=A0A9W7C9B6_9STRA|nr:hypothetical protein TrVE_jg11521 [Triparma verrucosa]
MLQQHFNIQVKGANEVEGTVGTPQTQTQASQDGFPPGANVTAMHNEIPHDAVVLPYSGTHGKYKVEFSDGSMAYLPVAEVTPRREVTPKQEASNYESSNESSFVGGELVVVDDDSMDSTPQQAQPLRRQQSHQEQSVKIPKPCISPTTFQIARMDPIPSTFNTTFNTTTTTTTTTAATAISPSQKRQSVRTAQKRLRDFELFNSDPTFVKKKFNELKDKFVSSGGKEEWLEDWSVDMTPSTLYYIAPSRQKFRSTHEVIRHFDLTAVSPPRKKSAAATTTARKAPQLIREIDSGKQPGTMLKKAIVKPLLELIGRKGDFDDEISKITNLFTAENPPSKILNCPDFQVYDKYFLSEAISVNVVSMYLFCWERQEMYHRKKSNPANHKNQDKSSSFPIFSNYKWCNVYRELDRGTRFLRGQLLKPHVKACKSVVLAKRKQLASEPPAVVTANDPQNIISQELASPTPESIAEVLWYSLIYRRANSVWTWDALGGIPPLPKNAEETKKFNALVSSFEGIKDETPNGKFFATCHIDSGGMDKYKLYLRELLGTINKGPNKGRRLIDVMGANISDIILSDEKATETSTKTKAERIFDTIIPLKGNGRFFCWQITSDIIEGCGIEEEKEWMELGPGALSGVERVFFGKAADKSSRGKFIFKEIKTRFGEISDSVQKNIVQDICRIIRGLQDHVFEHMGLTFRKFRNLDINMKNLEHCLCEFSKYCNMIEDLNGAKKTVYEPTKETGTKMNMDLNRKCCVCDDAGKGADAAGKERFNETLSVRRMCASCAEVFCEGCVGVLGEWTGKFGQEGQWSCPFCVACEAGRASSSTGATSAKCSEKSKL